MKKIRITQVWAVISTLLLIVVLVSACTAQGEAYQEAVNRAANAEYYIPKNGVELRNYNYRQELADDPTVILWCTSAFSTPGSPMFTIPIIGKLTSGAKRPFANDPGPDGMYGSSGEYRYGFGPTGKMEYYDFYGIETFCTTMPTVWQREATVLVLEKDPVLVDATNRAHDALNSGNAAAAEQILIDAINQVKNR